ncbi:MAG: MotA/TolQ/ExbB proton channel family protein [Phycisphaerae bacterium]|nr:MotA/TolQ/ExbB proton channel family protein [Phycisphaerae bacterium]
MDISTVIGLVVGISLISFAILSGSSFSAFVDAPSMMIVIGGAFAAALISFPLRNVLGVAKVVKNCFFSKPANPMGLITDMVGYAEVARRDGILSLESLTKDIKDEFVVSGIQMAVDGTDPELIEQIMSNELEAVADRHADGKALFDNIGKYAPAFGMIGTLIGLVKMLQAMDDPSAIGPAMAVALLTTLYGALLANLVALPLADKLSLRSEEEMRLKMIVIRGVMAIQSGDNPRVVEQKLKTFLPYKLRSEGSKAQAA